MSSSSPFRFASLATIASLVVGFGSFNVASGVLKQDGTLVTWSTVSHDNMEPVANYGDCLKTASIDAFGNTTKSRTDAAGRTLESEDALGKVSVMTYDHAGNVLTAFDANDVGQTCVYDIRGRRTSCTDTYGDKTATVYDAHNNVIETVDSKNYQLWEQESIDAKTVTCKFDPRDRRFECTDRINGVTTTRFDQNSNVTSITDSENSVTAYEYDIRNLRVKTIHPDHFRLQPRRYRLRHRRTRLRRRLANNLDDRR